MTEEMIREVPLSLTSLLWEDVLFKKVLPCLSLPDLFQLRAVSKKCQELVDAYFVVMPVLTMTPWKHNCSRHHLSVLARLCTNLRVVNFSECSTVTTPLLNELFSRNHKITTLILNRVPNLESSCLQHVIISCKNLKVLRLRHCYWLTAGCLNATTLHHNNLEEADLSFCHLINRGSALNCFLMKLPKLKILELCGLACTDSILSTILAYCRNLEALLLCKGQYSSYRIKQLIEGLPKLKYINIRYHTFTDVDYIREDTLKEIGRQNKVLVSDNIRSSYY